MLGLQCTTNKHREDEMMRSSCLAVLVSFAPIVFAASTAEAAEQSVATSDGLVDFQMLARWVYLQPTAHDANFPLGGHLYPDFSALLRIGPRWTVEGTIGWPWVFGAGTPGSEELRHQTLNFMINTFTGRYDLLAEGKLRPYVGLGLAYIALQYDSNSGDDGAPHFNSVPVEPVAQGGLDWIVTRHVFVNADLRYLPTFDARYDSFGAFNPDRYPGSHVLHIAPMLFGLGIGFRF
jgi:outer membrane protein W